MKKMPQKSVLPEFDLAEFFLPRKGSDAEKKGVSWVYEISTPKGFAYVQAVAWNKKDVFTLIRVIPGRFKKAVEDPNKLNSSEEEWYTFFDIKSLVRKKLARPVSALPIDKKSKERPSFARSTIAGQGETLVSFSVERPIGSGNWRRVNRLNATPKEIRLSPSDYFTPPLFLYRIATGWTPGISYQRTIGSRLRTPDLP